MPSVLESEDEQLLMQSSLDVLPKTPAARRAVQAARDCVQAASITDPSALAPSLVALAGAEADEELAAMEGDFCLSTDRGIAVAVRLTATLDDKPSPLGCDERVREALDVLVTRPFSGGLAIAGMQAGTVQTGLADLVLVIARGAAEAAFAAQMIADATTAYDPAVERQVATSGPLNGRNVTVRAGMLETDAIWEALSAGVRCASALRQGGAIRGAALSLKGRGRTVGGVDGDRLLRFGVSEWR